VTVKHPSFGNETFDIALRQSLSAVIALAPWTNGVAGVAALTAPPSGDAAEFVALTAPDWPVDDAGSSADEDMGSPVEPLEQAAAMRTGAKNSNDERRMEGMSLLLVVWNGRRNERLALAAFGVRRRRGTARAPREPKAWDARQTRNTARSTVADAAATPERNTL
jgi:hypothetical protein